MRLKWNFTLKFTFTTSAIHFNSIEFDGEKNKKIKNGKLARAIERERQRKKIQNGKQFYWNVKRNSRKINNQAQCYRVHEHLAHKTAMKNRLAILEIFFLFYCMTPLKKQTSNHCSFYILFVGTSFRHSTCSRYNFKCDFIRKKVVKKSCVCVLLLEGTTRWKREEKKSISRPCYVLDDVKLNVPLLVVSACVKISEKSILNNFLRLLCLLLYEHEWNE